MENSPLWQWKISDMEDFIGKSTISMAMFNGKLLQVNYCRVYGKSNSKTTRDVTGNRSATDLTTSGKESCIMKRSLMLMMSH